MIIGEFEKQPGDVIDYDINYSEWLPAGDNITSSTVSITPPGGLTHDRTVNNDPRLKVWLSGGVDATTYTVEVTAVTEDGRTKQSEFRVKVKEH